MTENNKKITFLCTALALTLPFPGRIAFGFISILHFNVCVILLTLILHAVKRLKLENIMIGICSMELIALTIFYKQVLIIFCPVVALTAGYSIYLPAMASVSVIIENKIRANSLKEDCLVKMKKSLGVSAFSFIIFVLRDIFGFSTITLPGWQNFFIVKLPVLIKNASFSSFLATLPGCLVLVVLAFFVYSKILEKKSA